MRKIFAFITVFALTVGLIGYLFHYDTYNIMEQLGKIQMINFADPIGDLQNIISESNGLFEFVSEDAAWYEYFVIAITWFFNMMKMPIILVKDFFQNVYYGLMSVLYILGYGG